MYFAAGIHEYRLLFIYKTETANVLDIVIDGIEKSWLLILRIQPDIRTTTN